MCGFNFYLYEREPQVVLVSFVRDRIHDLLFILLLELVYQTWLQFLSVSKQFINSCTQILKFVLNYLNKTVISCNLSKIAKRRNEKIH